MQVYIPENLKVFTTSHWINGKCQVELEAVTGRVRGDLVTEDKSP